MKRILNTQALLLIALCSFGSSSHAQSLPTVFGDGEQYTLVAGQGAYHYTADQLNKVGTSGPSPYKVMETSPLSIHGLNYTLVVGSQNHWTAKRAFYALADESGSVLWIKSPESACQRTHSEAFEIHRPNSSSSMLLCVAYVDKTLPWNDTAATAFSVLEIGVNEALEPILLAREELELDGKSQNASALYNRKLGSKSITEYIEFNYSNSGAALQVELWPNPSSQYIRLSSNSPIETIRLFDVSGMLLRVLPSGNRSFDISELAPGSYFLEVSQGKEVERLQFVKT